MREVVIRSWCDACDAQDEPVKNESEHVVTVTLSSVGTKARSLDVCERHYKELVDPLEKLLRSHGAAPEDVNRVSVKPERRPTPTSTHDQTRYQCPQCSLTGLRRGVITHLVSIHGMGEVEASHAVPPEGGRAECPECGFLANLGTGLSTHLRFAHQMSKEQARVVQQRIAREQTEIGEDHVCPACRKPFASHKALSDHTRKVHGKALTTLQAKAVGQ